MTTRGHDRAVFRATGPVVVRIATLPADRVRMGRPRRLDFDDPEELASRLLELVADPHLAEAIEVSSSSLGDVIARVGNGERPAVKRLRRALISAAGYRLRMLSRPTPFGVHAGVALADPGSDPAVRVGDRAVKRVVPDAGWLAAVLESVGRDPAARGASVVQANNLCRIRGDRVVLPYRQRPPGHGEDVPLRQLSVTHSAPVAFVLEHAAHPIRYERLHRLLAAEFPGVDARSVDGLLGGLLEQEILLTDLDSCLDAGGRFERFRSRLRDRRSLSATVADSIARLDGIAELLTSYQQCGPGKGRERWRQARAAMVGMQPTDRPPIQVDLRADVALRLPDSVTAEAAGAASALWRLSPRTSPLDDYHEEFLERYGTDRLVGVLDLLDPHLGLGPPDGYQNPPPDRGSAGRTDHNHADHGHPEWRDQQLAGMLSEQPDELVLDDAAIDRLSEPADDRPPTSADICLSLFAESARALAGGDYALAIGAGAGSPLGGGMSGRFAHLLGIGDRLTELNAAAEPDCLRAQVCYRPQDPRNGNLVHVPSVAPYRIPVGCYHDPDEEAVLDPREVMVGSTGHRFFLTVPALGGELVAVTPHMLNPVTQAPNVARFLVAVSLTRSRPMSPWRWGRLAVLPRLPRVRYGRVVLAPARWRADAELADSSLSWEEWQRSFARWRSRLRVPDRVRAGPFDNQLELDLDDELQCRLFRDQLRRDPERAVVESVSVYGSLGVTDGHTNEIVVPLLAERPEAHPAHTTRAIVRPAESVRHLPGGEWLYARLSVVTDMHDSVLGRHVGRLLSSLPAEIDRWFFVRYATPGPHLRLRFHCDMIEPYTKAMAALHDWAEELATAGVIGDLTLDTYEPETERYGGPDALADAERLFCDDSDLVLRLLELSAAGSVPWDPELAAAMSFLDLLTALDEHGHWDWGRWFLATFPIEWSNRTPAARRREAAAWLRPETVAANLGAADERIADVRGRRSASAARYGRHLGLGSGSTKTSAVASVLHMHANRMLGTDRDAEHRAMGLLRAALRARIGEVDAG